MQIKSPLAVSSELQTDLGRPRGLDVHASFRRGGGLESSGICCESPPKLALHSLFSPHISLNGIVIIRLLLTAKATGGER